MTEPLLLPIPLAARVLGIGRDAAYRLVADGRLRAVRIGRRVLVPRRELEAFCSREAEAREAGAP